MYNIRWVYLLGPPMPFTTRHIRRQADYTSVSEPTRGVSQIPECTTFTISHFRASLRDHMRFFERLGLLRNREPLIRSRIRRLKPPKDKPVRDFYYRWG